VPIRATRRFTLSKKNARKIAQILERGGHLVVRKESTHVKGRWGDPFPSDESKTQFRTPLHLRKPHYSSSQGIASYDVSRVVKTYVDTRNIRQHRAPKRQ